MSIDGSLVYQSQFGWKPVQAALLTEMRDDALAMLAAGSLALKTMKSQIEGAAREENYLVGCLPYLVSPLLSFLAVANSITDTAYDQYQ